MLVSVMSVPTVGGYISLPKIILMLVFVTPWLYYAPWVARDVKRVLAHPVLWNVAVLAAGAVGFFLWVVLPMYIVGLLIYVVLTAAACGAYVVYRDGRVDAKHKVLTMDHLQDLVGRKKREAQFEIIQKVKLYDYTNKITFPPSSETADAAQCRAYNLAQELLHDVVYYRASEADLSPVGQQTRVRFVIDGVVVERPAMILSDSEGLIQLLKPIAGMDAEDRRRPQHGKISVDVAGRPTDMTLATAGTTGGQRVQFKIVQEVVRTHLEDLGLSSDVLKRLQAVTKEGKGLLIVSGRPQSGVTSTLYSLLREQDAYTKQLVTLEARAVVDLENVTQNVYAQAAELPANLASVLRRDPDVIMMDQCGDAKTAGLVLEAAREKTVLLGMQASDTFVALARWIKTCEDPLSAVANLRGVLCQTLIRKLCTGCREEYHPDPQMLAKANMTVREGDRFCRPLAKDQVDEKGRPIICPACQNTRYVGRTGVFEFLEVTDEVRQLVAANASLSQIQTACRKNKMLYLQEQALEKVKAGITSIQEVIRVTQKEKKERSAG